MWIRSETNKLYNLTHAHTVKIEKREDGFVVAAHFSTPNDQEQVGELTKVKPTEVEPMAIIRRIENSLADNDRVLDLMRSAAQAGHF